MSQTPEYVELESGIRINVDETPYFVKCGTLYVYCPTANGYDYVPIGKVKEQ